MSEREGLLDNAKVGERRVPHNPKRTEPESSMYRKDVSPSGLPSLLLPCTHCGHRMMFASVEPARLGSGVASNDLEDITHHCVQCGTAVVRTMRSPSAAA
jgi:hypothetical protein